MCLLGHQNISPAAFYAFATIDMMRQAIDAPATQALTQDRLEALYSLR